MGNKKDIAESFLQLTAKGFSRKAFEMYVSSNFNHHNAFFAGDGKSLMLAMEEAATIHPNKTLTIHRIVSEDNIVAVHSHVQNSPSDLGYALMHIFRFDGDKIVELWDFGQAVPPNMVNENGMF